MESCGSTKKARFDALSLCIVEIQFLKQYHLRDDISGLSLLAYCVERSDDLLRDGVWCVFNSIKIMSERTHYATGRALTFKRGNRI